nr:YkyB family protein [Pontibacillus litoralis]
MIAQAIFVVNKHAKTASEPKQLYTVKKKAIEKLLKQNRAKKVGLHFSDHPKYSHQHSTLLVQVDNFYFHIPPKKADFDTMKHLGKIDQSFRNPKTTLSLTKAKKILYTFLNWEDPEKRSKKNGQYQRSHQYYNHTSPFSPWGQFTTWNHKSNKHK